MNSQAVIRVMQELLEQAESFGYDYAIKVAPSGGDDAVLYFKDLDEGTVHRFAVTVEAAE